MQHALARHTVLTVLEPKGSRRNGKMRQYTLVRLTWTEGVLRGICILMYIYIYHIYIDIDIFLDIPFKKQIQVEFLFDEHGISMNQRENDEQRKKHKKCPLGKARDLNDWPIS